MPKNEIKLLFIKVQQIIFIKILLYIFYLSMKNIKKSDKKEKNILLKITIK